MIDRKKMRWPVYILCAVCLLLILSLLSSWNMETELRKQFGDLKLQLEQCYRYKSLCKGENLNLIQERDDKQVKVSDLISEKKKLLFDIKNYQEKVSKAESQVNHTLVDVELCKTELQSLKNLQLSKSTILETLRLEKDTLNTQLKEKKLRIDDLEKEVEKLKQALTSKSVPVSPSPSKVITPAAAPPKLSPSLNSQNLVNEPVLDNDAKEDVNEDINDANVLNDGPDFDNQQ